MLVRSDSPAFDDLATWTGPVVRHPDGRWFMFATGASLSDAGANAQSIGYAVSTDLYEWSKAPGPVLQADARSYEKYADGNWHDKAFRDPWVLEDPDGDLVDRGVVGHAWSADQEHWSCASRCRSPGRASGSSRCSSPSFRPSRLTTSTEGYRQPPVDVVPAADPGDGHDVASR